jgi:hypothetical protein
VAWYDWFYDVFEWVEYPDIYHLIVGLSIRQKCKYILLRHRMPDFGRYVSPVTE